MKIPETGMKKWCMLHLFLVSIAVTVNSSDSSQSIVRTLPGYHAPLPFKLETGYIGVGEDDGVQLFYYFIESEGDPKKDPLLLWLLGGPGCSGFSALVYEFGPLSFDSKTFDESLPSLSLNPHSWTKVASIIFIDSPVGTGFSYATTPEAYPSSDTKAMKDNYSFLRKWLLNHPEFVENPLYIGGDSYGGKIVPMVALEIVKGNEAGLEPQMLLKGYIVGNSLTDENHDTNEIIPYAHRMALISDELFEVGVRNFRNLRGYSVITPNLRGSLLAKSSCHGEYVNPDPKNEQCLYALRLVEECTNHVHKAHILEPDCALDDLRLQSSLTDDPVDLILLPKQEEQSCRGYNHLKSNVWANDETVRKALGVREGTKAEWKRCNRSLSYDHDVPSVLRHHQLLGDKGFRALAYSGDHDMLIPYMCTLKWIRNLNLTVDEEWRPWNVDGQVAGYTVKYENKFADPTYLTFATVKGAGHTAPEYKPKECLAMIERWLSTQPL